MDDYRDLVTAGLTLMCAGIMLVAGQLYIEHHPAQAIRPVDSPQQSPALISHAPSADENASHETATDPRQDVEKNGVEKNGVEKNRAG